MLLLLIMVNQLFSAVPDAKGRESTKMDIGSTKCRSPRKRTRNKFEGDHRYFYQFCKRTRLYFSELQVLNLLQE